MTIIEEINSLVKQAAESTSDKQVATSVPGIGLPPSVPSQPPTAPTVQKPKVTPEPPPRTAELPPPTETSVQQQPTTDTVPQSELEAQYSGMTARPHRIGSLKANWQAAKNWAGGYEPGINASFTRFLDKDTLKHDMSSLSAPTLVDYVHNAWNKFTGKGGIYGHSDNGDALTSGEYNNRAYEAIAALHPNFKRPSTNSWMGWAR